MPIKAAIANPLSIGASLGVVVAIFQWGWVASWIGVDSSVPIVSFIPTIMFGILFGLSMDYEVFILSRVREEYSHSGDPHYAVLKGLASSARVITAAALIMISVFGAFVLGDDVIIKMFGIGLAVAVLLDATIVRMVIVPAVMTLFDKAAWVASALATQPARPGRRRCQASSTPGRDRSSTGSSPKPRRHRPHPVNPRDREGGTSGSDPRSDPRAPRWLRHGGR